MRVAVTEKERCAFIPEEMEGSMVRKTSVIVAGLLVLGGVAGLVKGMAEGTPKWVEGLYWTYKGKTEFLLQPPVVHAVSELKSQLTFLLMKSQCLGGLELWSVGIVVDLEGRKTLEITTIAGFPATLLPAPLMRWPLPVDFIPGVHFPSVLARSAAILGIMVPGAKVRIEGSYVFDPQAELPFAPPGWALPFVAREVLNLVVEAPAPVSTSAGRYDTAFPVTYTLAKPTGMHEGKAWFAPEVGWWVRGEGQVQGDIYLVRYSLDLLEYGVLESDKWKQKIGAAIENMRQHDPVNAEKRMKSLETLGISLQ
jgi:hypothetical protein